MKVSITARRHRVETVPSATHWTMAIGAHALRDSRDQNAPRILMSANTIPANMAAAKIHMDLTSK